MTRAQGLAGGFTLVPIDDRWVELRHECGKSTTFVNGTADHVGWYVDAHQCDVPGAWHADVGDLSGCYPWETAALLRYMTWLVTATSPAAWEDDACFSAGCETFETLRRHLLAAQDRRGRSRR